MRLSFLCPNPVPGLDPAVLKLSIWKELLHAFRDKHVFIYTFLVPVVLYPLIVIMAFDFISLKEAAREKSVKQIGLAGKLSDYDPAQRKAIDCLFANKDFKRYKPEANTQADLDWLIARGAISGYVTKGKNKQNGFGLAMVINHDLNGIALVAAANETVDKWYDQTVREAYKQKGLSPFNARPFKVKLQDSAPDQKGIFSLALAFFVFSILYLSLGAAYPAIFVSAEESEFFTLDTIRIVPASAWSMMLGKWWSVSAIAFLSAVLNLVSMLAVSVFLSQQAGNLIKGFSLKSEFALPATSYAWLFVAYVALSLTIAACMILTASLCRSVRSAQQWVSIPLSLFIFIPVLALYPKNILSEKTALVPLMNLVLMVKACVVGEISPPLFYTAMGISLCLAAVCLYLAKKILFDMETDPLKLVSYLVRQNKKA
ncbi:MAG: hypothetical protein K2X70_00245 [Candidatus Obscuribacterales bacterium]|nr:hypothetical protein [Candidatus Obscuribacterales bacterium]